MPKVPQDSVNQIVQYIEVAANALRNASDSRDVTVAAVVLSILPIVQNTKANKGQCVRILEEIHWLLCALLALSFHPELDLSPQMLDNISKIAQTLQKFHGCLRSQQELGTFRRFFRQSEITAQLESCQAELNAALDVFMTLSGADLAAEMLKFNTETEGRHQEVLELLSAQSDGQSSKITVSARGSILQLSNSSSALSLLPASPKIFHGREGEVQEVVSSLLCPARVAVLGPGGIGKTTLAIACLHHPSITQRYGHRHFVSCEAANNAADLIATIGLHLGIEPSTKFSQAIVMHFHECGPAVLVLDNLETPWEPVGTRAAVEDFLSALTDVAHLTLLITMRGAERPAKVKWSRPFLPPLRPLPASATRQTFVEIADEPEIGEESALSKLLDLTGHLPLAVILMAGVASFEGYAGALSRWKTEHTTLLSEGTDKCANLEQSIIMSLTSPRIASSADAKQLLSLLSLLPDGIFDKYLLAPNIPVPDVLHCKSTLIRTSLAYIDHDGRLKVLSPIREYMHRAHPPVPALVKPLRTHFQDLLTVYSARTYSSSGDLVFQLMSNLGNMHSLILNGLTREGQVSLDVADSVLTLNSFSERMLKGRSALMDYLPDAIESIGDMKLRWQHTNACLLERGPHISAVDAEKLIAQGIQHFNNLLVGDENVEQAAFYNAVSKYYNRKCNLKKALEFNGLAMASAAATHNITQQLKATVERAEQERTRGHLQQSIACSREGQRIARCAGLLYDECQFLVSEAGAWSDLGRPAHSLALCSQVRELLAACTALGSELEVDVLDIQADAHFQKSEYAEARALNAAVVRMTAPTHSPYYHANALTNLAQLDIATGSADEEDAIRHLSASTEICARLGWVLGQLFSDSIAAPLALHRGETAQARALYTRCLSRTRSYGTGTDIIAACLESLANLALAQTTKAVGHTHQALLCLGDIFVAQGADETGLSVFRAVLDGATAMDVHRRRADAMMRIGDIVAKRGDVGEARRMWADARPLFVRSLQNRDVLAIDARLAELQPAIQEPETSQPVEEPDNSIAAAAVTG